MLVERRLNYFLDGVQRVNTVFKILFVRIIRLVTLCPFISHAPLLPIPRCWGPIILLNVSRRRGHLVLLWHHNLLWDHLLLLHHRLLLLHVCPKLLLLDVVAPPVALLVSILGCLESALLLLLPASLSL